MGVKWTLLVALVSSGAAARAGRAADTTPDGLPAAPVTQEHRYRLSAAIRPLLFWVGAKNVGGARIVWRWDGGERLGYELLLGSDPARAPRRINRWGWVREDADPSGATMLGVMNRSEEDSLDQVKARLQSEGKDGYFFKLIRARVEGGGARAESTTVYAPEDYTFRRAAAVRRVGEAPAPRADGPAAGGHAPGPAVRPG
jgi:hypothetical protein